MTDKELLNQAIEDIQELTDWFIELNRRLLDKGVLDGYVHLDMMLEKIRKSRLGENSENSE